MVKKYVVMKEQVESTFVADSENPVQSKTIKAALDAKLDKGATSGDVNKVPTVKETATGSGVYELTLSALPEGKQADWTQDTTTETDFIKNKPFRNIGTGLSVKEIAGYQTLTADYQLHFQIFDALPTASEAYAQVIALVKKSPTSTEYYEHACVNTGTTASPVWKWEQIGAVDLQIDQTPSAITINGTELQTADDTKVGLMSSTDHADMQRIANKVTAFQTTTDDTHYPSEKLVKDNLDLKFNKNDVLTTWNTTVSTTQVPSESLVKTGLSGKIDYATGSTSTSFTVGVDAVGYYIEE